MEDTIQPKRKPLRQFHQSAAILLTGYLSSAVFLVLLWYFLIKFESHYFPWPLFPLSILFLAPFWWYRAWLWHASKYSAYIDRVRIHHRISLFQVSVQEIRFDQVVRISYDKKGIGKMLWDYGDVKLHSTSTDTVILKNVSNPKETAEKLIELWEDIIHHS